MLIATAGHVDHGKTTLVNALTGIDTDRLPEEKSRGLTIELGFAYMPSDNGQTLGFIDVPGHEKFIRNMAAGVGAIDVALLVVAADDGVMPQTREHVAILDLYGIRRCVVVITRCDLVDAEQIESVKQQVQLILEGTGLAQAVFQPVCAPDNIGIEALKSTLYELAENLDQRNTQTHFRLAIDRSFSVRGAGTVVTGCVFSGCVNEGDSVQILPGLKSVRVREMHVNGTKATTAKSGNRAALNLSNLSHQEAARGSWVTSPHQDTVSSCIDVHLRVLGTESRALRHWTPVHVHAGAATTTGRIALYEARTVEPNEQTFAQLVLTHPQHMLFGDHFVLRDQSATRTIGGGVVTDPFASRHKTFRKNRLTQLSALHNDDHSLALLDTLKVSQDGLLAENFRQSRNLFSTEFEAIVATCKAQRYTDSQGVVRLIAETVFNHAKSATLIGVQQFHQLEPESQGIVSEVLRLEQKLSPTPFAAAVDSLLREKALNRVGDRLQEQGYEPRLTPAAQTLLDRLLALVQPQMLKPPAVSELAKAMDTSSEDLLQKTIELVKAGHLVKVANNRLYHPDAVEQLVATARELSVLHAPAGFDAKAFRDRTGIGRNISIDVLEYFDNVGITRRIADRRIVKR